MTITDALTIAAKEIHAAVGVQETLDAVVRAASCSLPGLNLAGISVGYADGRLETLAASEDLVNKLDQAQYDAGQGPCLYAMDAETVVRVEHARDDERWPGFMVPAVALGLRSMLGVRLHVDEVEMAALNLYSTETDTLDENIEDYAELFATYAALGLGRARREDQLSEALVSRRVIGQATGIVMERYSVDEQRAFRYLTRVSNDTNVKLRDLAAQIVADSNAANGVGGSK